jgi:hypothetical protein
VVVIEDRLAASLQAPLVQFARDLEQEGYRVVIDSSLSARTTPLRIRELLRDQRRAEPQLAGAILIGEFPAPLYNDLSNQGDAYWHDHLADLYYMDLDGEWFDTDGNGVFDRHGEASHRGLAARLARGVGRLVGRDRRLPEIWVSRLRAGTLRSLGDEVTLLRRYFERNHAYRTGTLAVPPARAFVAADSRVLASGWGARPRLLYRDVSAAECQPNTAKAIREFLASVPGYQLGIIGIASGPRIHHWDSTATDVVADTLWATPEGRRRITEHADQAHGGDITSAEVAALEPRVLFYHILSSETGRHDYPDYLGGAYLFFGQGLAVLAGTQHSGTIGVPVLYQDLAAGLALGEAARRAISWSLAQETAGLTIGWCDRDEPWTPGRDIYRAVILGDGTLRLKASVDSEMPQPDAR